jgi:tetratricopeptide (TPR) repeat protein
MAAWCAVPATGQEGAPAQSETAQEAAQPAPTPAERLRALLDAEPLSGRTLEAIVADTIARRALEQLRAVDTPTADHYRVAALGMRAALRLSPDDLHLHRRLADALRAAGDEEAELAVLRRILELDPGDTVVQLRLLNRALRSRQTVEDRLAAYDRLLGPAGDGLDDALRSRLALDAAMLARETGDERGFVTRLTRATQLDATNKAAAVVASGFALSRLDDPMARVESLANVVLADPVDAQAHLDLARELLSHGAYAGAGRFLERASDVFARSGARPTPEMRTAQVVIGWANDGPEAMFAQFDDAVAFERYLIDQRQRSVDEGDLPPEEAPAPYVPRRWREEGRLAIALAVDDADQTARALEALEAVDAQRLADLEDADGADADEERARIEASRLMRHLWAGAPIDDASGRLGVIEPRLDADTTALVRAWIDLRSGAIEEAREAFGALAGFDPRARAGLALSYELEGAPVDAARRYALLVREAPGTLLGMWARTRVERLLESPVRESPLAAELNAYARSLPSALDRMTADPSSFIDLSLAHVRDRIGMLGRVEVRLRLRNGGVLPLAVGDESPLNSRLLLMPEVSLGGTRVLQGLTPEVASLGTRLRLMPGESLEVVYWAGQGPAGRALAQYPAARGTLRWRGLQGFGVMAEGGYAAGAMNATAMSDMLQRTAPPESLLGIDGLTQRISTATGEPRLRAMAMALWLLTNGGNLADPDERFALRSAMAEAIVGVWPSLSPLERSWALHRTPDSLIVAETGAIEAAAFADNAPMTVLALLMTRSGAFPDRVLALGRASEDPLVQEYARLVERLQSAAPAR